MFYRPMF